MLNLNNFHYMTQTLLADYQHQPSDVKAVFDLSSYVLDSSTPEGDDSILTPDGGPLLDFEKQRKAPLAAKCYEPQTRLVLYPGLLARGSLSWGVLALQKALRNAHVRSSRPTGIYGLKTSRQVCDFQERNGIKADGVYTEETHVALSSSMDNYSAYLMNRHKGNSKKVLVATALYTVTCRKMIHYSQSTQRMNAITYELKPPLTPESTDSSSMITWYYYSSGLNDPNGNKYNGRGFSGTLILNGKIVTSPSPGDILFFDRKGSSYENVAMYIGDNKCVTHNSEAGPLVLSSEYREDLNEIRSYAR